MQWHVPALLGAAALLAVGLGFYAYASLPETPNFARGSETPSSARGAIAQGHPLEVSAEIPVGWGVFAVEIAGHPEDARVNARVLGPINTVAASASIDAPAHREAFEIHEVYWYPCTDAGACPQGGIVNDRPEFTLIVESDGSDPVNVVAALGQGLEPDSSRAVFGDASLYMLAAGAVGMAVTAADAAVRRRAQALVGPSGRAD